MSAYYKSELEQFIELEITQIIGELSRNQTGTSPEQLDSWEKEVVVLKDTCKHLISNFVSTSWALLLEYRMFRLHRRIDAVLLADEIIFVIEFKMGADSCNSADIAQTEDYALDLRDFHAASHNRKIVPILCASESVGNEIAYIQLEDSVSNVLLANKYNLHKVIQHAYETIHADNTIRMVMDDWDMASYSPVPTIIEAAELLYASHDVEEIHSALADQSNLTGTTDRLIEIIAEAREKKRRVVCFVTGVPGSGKTLTGLNAVHDPRFRQYSDTSSAFLSGNSPLVEVLREALAVDHAKREGVTKKDALRKTKAEIQLLMRYLDEYERRDINHPPHEHVIVFDEAQRAWNAAYGKQKFDREASEPTMFLEIMARHNDWAVIIALVGGGQEINKGEGGLSEWGQSISLFEPEKYVNKGWDIHASPHVLEGTAVTAGSVIFPEGVPTNITIETDERLHLPVSIRSHRCEVANAWIDAVLEGDKEKARLLSRQLNHFPIYITRSLDEMREWLTRTTRGHRRCGLVASSNARRLRGYGLGVALSTQDLSAVTSWYLKPQGDVRSSYQLEVTATEYACQGLELDRVGLCWAEDMTWSNDDGEWKYRSFRGSKWNNTKQDEGKKNTTNTYRVLMSRAREAMIIWVPPGDDEDETRPVEWMDETAAYLKDCGISELMNEII